MQKDQLNNCPGNWYPFTTSRPWPGFPTGSWSLTPALRFQSAPPVLHVPDHSSAHSSHSLTSPAVIQHSGGFLPSSCAAISASHANQKNQTAIRSACKLALVPCSELMVKWSPMRHWTIGQMVRERVHFSNVHVHMKPPTAPVDK